jgi:hypothetical protein
MSVAGGAPASGTVPESVDFEMVDMVDIEAPPPPVLSDDEWDEEEDDGWLLRCFTLCTSFCAGFHTAIQRRLLMCGIYLRDRRFWVCKVIILIMDIAILRGAISMGEEYCAQDDEVSEFGWIIWSSFLVFCKFVYLRPGEEWPCVPEVNTPHGADTRGAIVVVRATHLTTYVSCQFSICTNWVSSTRRGKMP